MTVGVGVIGVGFMGRTHLAAYRDAARAGHPCRVVAVCDRSGRLAAGGASAGNLRTGDAGGPLFDPATVAVYREADGLLADRRVDLVSLCTYTDTHAELAIRALRAGKHVLVEKPVAISAAGVQRLADAAAAARTLCMPAMCIRFWPAWRWLHDRIAAGTFGAVRSASFQRLATPPSWSAEFYADPARSGGALWDLHIHDTDFIAWCFGTPRSVFSAGTIDHLSTLYRCPRGPAHVAAEGGWHHSPGFGFRMRYVVVFDEATADFDIGRDPPLRLAREGRFEPVTLEPITGYDGEIRALVSALAGRGPAPDATMAEALQVARVLEAEAASLRTDRPVSVG